MVNYQYNGKQGETHRLEDKPDTLVVRGLGRVPIEQLSLSKNSRSILSKLTQIFRLPDAGVDVLQCGKEISRDEARSELKKEPSLRFAGKSLADPQFKTPALYTENLFIKFKDNLNPNECKRLLNAHKLNIKNTLGYAQNAFFVGAQNGIGQRVFDLALDLLNQENSVELCHPELIREMAYRGAFPQQWHLKPTTINGHPIDAHASVEKAWEVTRGEGSLIAIIDDGVDVDHEEFLSSGKIIAPRDVTRKINSASPLAQDNHGTACAGVACASGNFGAAGVAPSASAIPIRLNSGLGSQAEADAFYWAAQHGADVISCSWGPKDGDWWDPNDSLHHQIVPLPDATRLAIDWAIRNGRNGKGCVITWAAGNGNEKVDNDGYASYNKVIAVAACNDQNTKSVYSDFGDAIWCAFPSNDFANNTLTPGIWTTDRRGGDGYNPGNNGLGDDDGNYTNSFGGTSSACPGAAGVAALIIARNPHLRWDEVKDIMRRSCDPIDPHEGNYNTEGHSAKYGYGRLNAARAVELAMPSRPHYIAIHTAVQDVAITDLQQSALIVHVGDNTAIKNIKIIVDIEHSYIGDLVVRLIPPSTTHAHPVMLHERYGGGTDNIKRNFDIVNTPELQQLINKNPQGQWTLQVEDKANADQGMIRKFTVELAY